MSRLDSLPSSWFISLLLLGLSRFIWLRLGFFSVATTTSHDERRRATKSDKKMTLDLVPFKPPQSFVYDASNKFQSSVLNYLLEDDEKFGFVVVDGNGALFATLQGNVRTILQKITVELPKKHGRGG